MNEIWNQTMAVVRLEIRKTFFARRSLWIYLLAILPAVIFFANSVYSGRERVRLSKIAATRQIEKGAILSIRQGMTLDQVKERLGEPYQKSTFMVYAGRQRGPTAQRVERGFYSFTDGETDLGVFVMDGRVQNVRRRGAATLDQILIVFASVFQLYFVRLAIFFGCAGVFTNLFRGELLDKSLHFYLLAPIPRGVLLLGKYLAGVVATAVIFSTSTALQYYAMLRAYPSDEIQKYLQGGGWDHLGAYMAVAALACLGYGSVFLFAGLAMKNPTVIVATLLLWESINIFLPAALKKISLIFYLQSLSPVAAPLDKDMPLLFRQLVSTAEPTGVLAGVAGIFVLAGIVLFLGTLQAQRLEINYSAD